MFSRIKKTIYFYKYLFLISLLISFLFFGTIKIQTQNININLNLKENTTSSSQISQKKSMNSNSSIYSSIFSQNSSENIPTLQNQSGNSSIISVNLNLKLEDNSSSSSSKSFLTNPINFFTTTIRTGGDFLGISVIITLIILWILFQNKRKNLKVQILNKTSSKNKNKLL